MALRVPKAELPRELRENMIKQLGAVPDGAPAGRIEVAGEPAAVSLVVQDGRVTRIYLVRNPRKLTRLDEPADLAR